MWLPLPFLASLSALRSFTTASSTLMSNLSYVRSCRTKKVVVNDINVARSHHMTCCNFCMRSPPLNLLGNQKADDSRLVKVAIDFPNFPDASSSHDLRNDRPGEYDDREDHLEGEADHEVDDDPSTFIMIPSGVI